MHMEYFKKIQLYKPHTETIDSPVKIEEVALLQDSYSKKILGRVKFRNLSIKKIIAVFIQLRANNIAGEKISLTQEKYIYQDICIVPGDIYGNANAIVLPDDVRQFEIILEKVVFEDGELWIHNTTEDRIVIPQMPIEIPKECVEQVTNALKNHLTNLHYIKYFYEESENFWECTCGKINFCSQSKCSFCSNKKNDVKEYLSKKNFYNILQEIQNSIEQEKEKHQKLLQQQEEQKRQEELKRQEEQKRQAECYEARYTKIKIAVIVATSILLIILFSYSSIKSNTEKKQLQEEINSSVEYANEQIKKELDACMDEINSLGINVTYKLNLNDATEENYDVDKKCLSLDGTIIFISKDIEKYLNITANSNEAKELCNWFSKIYDCFLDPYYYQLKRNDWDIIVELFDDNQNTSFLIYDLNDNLYEYDEDGTQDYFSVDINGENIYFYDSTIEEGYSDNNYTSNWNNSEYDSGYAYDPNDPYYSSNDHNGDGKISDEEFEDAMEDAIEDLYNEMYGQ